MTVEELGETIDAMQAQIYLMKLRDDGPGFRSLQLTILQNRAGDVVAGTAAALKSLRAGKALRMDKR